MAELSLDHVERDAFASHLDRVRVSELVWREASANSGSHREVTQCAAGCGRRPRPTLCLTVDDAQQGADAQRHAEVEPRLHLLPCPSVHADLAALAALAAAHENRSAGAIKIAFGQRERLGDPKTGSPEQDDQRPRAQATRAIACAAHHRDDLLH